MSETIDQSHLVLANFDGEIQIWRSGPFESEDEARQLWDSYADGVASIMEVEFLRLVTVCVRSDGSVHIIGEAPRV